MDIIQRIKELKKEKNAVILVHNYQNAELYDVADYIGDSLGLSIEAEKTKADIIVFCGVYFMAETAKILSPEKMVLIPDKDAGCPMADMVSAKDLRELKKEHPNAIVMCYVNTNAEVKAECDICCTSANAKDLVEDVLKDKEEIIFVPDKFLAANVNAQTGKSFIKWNGYCPSHLKILPQYVLDRKKEYPNAKVMVHPECPLEVTRLADAVLSTEGMCRYAKESGANEFIVGTEVGMVNRLSRDYPDKKFYPASDLAVCPNMKRINLNKVLKALEELKDEVVLSDEILSRAKRSIKNMLNRSL